MIARALAILVALAISGADARAESCSITSVTGVVFGTYNVFDASAILSAGAVAYECSGVQPSDTVTLELSGADDASTPRAMSSGAHVLQYQLYLDAARTLVWGAGTGGTATYGPLRPADGVPTSVPVYARVPARQDAAAGAYTATLLVTLQL
jgi:spore coat protein U-like protein